MSDYIGRLNLHDDGTVSFEGPYRVVTLRELEMALLATIGAEAAMQAKNPSESLTHIAASLLAKAGAAKARAARRSAVDAAVGAVPA